MIHFDFKKKVLIVDCQTTGINPQKNHLLQMAWCLYDPLANKSTSVISKTFKLSPEIIISNEIIKLLNITEQDIENGQESAIIFHDFQRMLKSMGDGVNVIAHYAQFEKIYLKKLYLAQTGTEQFNFNMYCTQKIAKQIFPKLPSHNLKALAGYFKLANQIKNNVVSHVEMTLEIWKVIVEELTQRGIENFIDLDKSTASKKNKEIYTSFDFNIERLTRLQISPKPGIYKFKDVNNSVLYVGKASSLRTRVNSYFRGRKNRDRRKLEMLAQAWEIETVDCSSPIEAALLECEEIKRLLPPYNILLKDTENLPIYYCYDYSSYSKELNKTYFVGPHKPLDSLGLLFMLFDAFLNKDSLILLGETINVEMLVKAWELFCINNQFDFCDLSSMNKRNLVYFGIKLLKQFEKIHNKASFEKWWLNVKNTFPYSDLTQAEKLSHKIYRLFIRTAEIKRKNKVFWRLFNSEVIINSTQKKFSIQNGIVQFNNSVNTEVSAVTSIQYDALSILKTALNNKTISIVF